VVVAIKNKQKIMNIVLYHRCNQNMVLPMQGWFMELHKAFLQLIKKIGACGWCIHDDSTKTKDVMHISQRKKRNAAPLCVHCVQSLFCSWNRGNQNVPFLEHTLESLIITICKGNTICQHAQYYLFFIVHNLVLANHRTAEDVYNNTSSHLGWTPSQEKVSISKQINGLENNSVLSKLRSVSTSYSCLLL
jgi:hypothetical protein